MKTKIPNTKNTKGKSLLNPLKIAFITIITICLIANQTQPQIISKSRDYTTLKPLIDTYFGTLISIGRFPYPGVTDIHFLLYKLTSGEDFLTRVKITERNFEFVDSTGNVVTSKEIVSTPNIEEIISAYDFSNISNQIILGLDKTSNTMKIYNRNLQICEPSNLANLVSSHPILLSVVVNYSGGFFYHYIADGKITQLKINSFATCGATIYSYSTITGITISEINGFESTLVTSDWGFFSVLTPSGSKNFLIAVKSGNHVPEDYAEVLENGTNNFRCDKVISYDQTNLKILCMENNQMIRKYQILTPDSSTLLSATRENFVNTVNMKVYNAIQSDISISSSHYTEAKIYYILGEKRRKKRNSFCKIFNIRRIRISRDNGRLG